MIEELSTMESRLSNEDLIHYNNKKKNLIVAFVLGSLFGPLGLFYSSVKTGLWWLIGIPLIYTVITVAVSLTYHNQMIKDSLGYILLGGIFVIWIPSSIVNIIVSRRRNKKLLVQLMRK